ncbi:MAG: archaemetzincin family Zn-dependent metalloprotease [Nitrososphaerota archaeon]|nr:archaemetzincin family Zn-dependent metalloprotease [Candidatus Bathyarchaeota archaeon]MDW8048593.1 archaemetzincin family Zn-dependent metalloprotease [Nitrososphaerota archaeon]
MGQIIILPVGMVDEKILKVVADALPKILKGCSVIISDYRILNLLPAYNPVRRQYLSTKILAEIREYIGRTRLISDEEDRLLGITDVDLYAAGFNYVFGEASYTEGVAVISIYRLRPEFYGDIPNEKLLHERIIKESVHELGHAFGLKHCSIPSCVMYFSSHILMTDKKGPGFCQGCRRKLNSVVL